MECSVCYEITSTCKLICGHSFCMSCIKEWYLKSEEEPTCPMCRQRLYFKGMHKQEQKWEEERHENEINQVFSNCFNSIIDESAYWKEEDDEFPFSKWQDSIEMSDYLIYNLTSMETYFNKCKNLNWDYWEDFEDAVNYEYDTFITKNPDIYYELVLKYESLINFSNVNSRRFLPDVYFSFV